MQLLTPRHHLPIPAATNWALIIRPAFSSNPTCHLAIWSKELTNREMFRPKYQCRWSRAAQYSRSIALLPRWVGGMGACPSPLSWACRTSLHWQEHAREPFEQAWAWRKQRVGCGGGAGGLCAMRTLLASREDNENSFASTARGVARPGIPNTVTNTSTAFIIIIVGGVLYQTHNHHQDCNNRNDH